VRASACTQEGEWGARTELAPGAGDGGCADKVGGVVEAVEDAGEEVPAAALLRPHGRAARVSKSSEEWNGSEEKKGRRKPTQFWGSKSSAFLAGAVGLPLSVV
jgi:hypothetical protein